MLVDVHPPGPRDPNGIHGAILNEIGTEDYVIGDERLLTVAAYIGGAIIEAFVAHFAVGEPLPQMPLIVVEHVSNVFGILGHVKNVPHSLFHAFVVCLFLRLNLRGRKMIY